MWNKFPQLLSSKLRGESFKCFFDLEEPEWNSSERVDKQDDENGNEDHHVNSFQNQDKLCEEEQEEFDVTCKSDLEAGHTYIFESDNEIIDTGKVHEEVKIDEVEKGDEAIDGELKLQCSNHSISVCEPNRDENDEVDLNNEQSIEIETQDPTIDFVAEGKCEVGNESKTLPLHGVNKMDSVSIGENEDIICENKIEQDILNVPLTFASRLKNKSLTPDSEDTYQSQFSSALSIEEVEKGIQKNPSVRTKKPKYTYSKNTKTERTENKKELIKTKRKKIISPVQQNQQDLVSDLDVFEFIASTNNKSKKPIKLTNVTDQEEGQWKKDILWQPGNLLRKRKKRDRACSGRTLSQG